MLAKIRAVLLFTAAFTPSIVTSAQDVPLFHFIEKPGPRNVGRNRLPDLTREEIVAFYAKYNIDYIGGRLTEEDFKRAAA